MADNPTTLKPAGKKKKETGLAITTKKLDDVGMWYQQVLVKSDMIEYYPEVSGCYILRPWAFRIWEEVQKFLGQECSRMGVEPSYFPMFVTEGALVKEAEHVEDFAPEVAWVTRSGKTELEKPIAIRPTSETIMYPAYAKWIRSHRDLPLRLVQYCNVVRWEFKQPTPFLRTREFLWQEGHTAFATKEEADAEVIDALDVYGRVYEELLAVPVIKGRKSHKEKFAGGDFTTTCEAFIPAANRAIQGATSHSLGQNFAKMFDISFTGGGEEGEEDEGEGGGGGAGAAATSKEKKYVWQNSWGITTRVIGVMVMVHGDDKGLVLPPRIAPMQLVAVVIHSVKDDVKLVDEMNRRARMACDSLKRAGVLTHFDDRSWKNPGWKYAHWELKGVPLRLEIGPRDLETNSCVLVRRDTGEKIPGVDLDSLMHTVPELLLRIQADMLNKARRERDSRITVAWNWTEFVAGIKKGNLVLAPWCCTTETEDWVKEETAPGKLGEAEGGFVVDSEAATATVSTDGEVQGKIPMSSAKTLCIPFNQPPMPDGTMCFTGRGGKALSWALWGRSF